MSVELKPAPPAQKPEPPKEEFVPINRKGMLDLWDMRFLIAVMAKRDLLGRYRGSMMGIFWTIISPLGQLLLYTFVFSVILKVKFGAAGGTTNFALYMMAGLLPFGALSEALTRVTTVIAQQPNLVKRVVFPLEILPLSVVVSAMVSQVVGTLILIVVATLMGYPIHASIGFLPLILFSEFLFVAGLSWLFASLGVYLTDLEHMMTLMLQAWMYASPIFFPASIYPANLRFLVTLNPIAGMVTDYRRVLLEGQQPDWQVFATYTSVGLVVWFIGYFFFNKTKRSFADVM